MIHAWIRALPSGLLTLVVIAGLVHAELPPTAAPPAPEGMEQLFNGTDLTGWDGDPRLWSVRDGVIHGETTPENATKGNTFLVWQGGDVGDFELRLSFRCNATNNSGIQYRSQRITDEKAPNKWVVRGYQHEIRNEETFPNVPGFIYDEGGVPAAGSESARWASRRRGSRKARRSRPRSSTRPSSRSS